MDVLGIVYQFLDATLSPSPAAIVRGWQNRAALPGSSSVVILTMLEAIRHGSNVHTRTAPQNTTGLDDTLSMLTEYIVQVDFCGTDEETVAMQAAQLVAVGRDPVAVDFFKNYALRPLYAEDARALPFENEARQWVTRYSVTLRLAGWTHINRQIDAFDAVIISTENVDVHHPITDE